MIKQVLLNNELLEQLLSIINKYKQNFGGLDNPLSNKHPFFDKKYADAYIRETLKIFDLEDLYNNFYVLVYVGKDGKEKPYPVGVDNISASGRFAIVRTSWMDYNVSYPFPGLIFDMENFQFVNYEWGCLISIDEDNQIIYGSNDINENYYESDDAYSFQILADGSIDAKSIKKSEYWYPTHKAIFILNRNNSHELDDVFFLQEKDGIKPRTFIDRMENIRSEYNHIEELDEVINDIVEDYNTTSRNNIMRLPMLIKIAKLNRLIKSDKTVNNDDPLPF